MLLAIVAGITDTMLFAGQVIFNVREKRELPRRKKNTKRKKYKGTGFVMGGVDTNDILNVEC